MRSMRNVKRDVARAPVRVGRKADDAMLEHLLRELSAAGESSAVRRTQAGPHLMRPMAYVASVAIITVVVAWLLSAGRAPQSHEPAPVTSGIGLLTEISLERAFRHGGIQAVESQFRRALAAPAGKPTTPSFEELLTELAGNEKDIGGTSL